MTVLKLQTIGVLKFDFLSKKLKMTNDLIVKKILKISEIKIMRNFFRFFENIIYWYCNRVHKKNKKINDKIFSLFQLFSEGKLYTFHR